MKIFLGWVGVCLLAIEVAGCANIPGNPTAPDALFSAFTQQQASEASIIADYQNENKSLLYLSRQNYSCGDPTSIIIKRYTGIKNPKEFVSHEYSDAAWSASVNVIQSYAKLLKVVYDNNTADQADIDTLTNAVRNIASLVPPAAPYAAAVGPVASVLKEFRGYVTNAQLAGLANRMKGSLAKAVGYLESPNVLNQLGAPEQAAFSVWDSCAREKLAYLLDISDPNFAKQYGPFRSASSPWRPTLQPPSARELDDAYTVYLTQREKYHLDLNFKKYLDDVLQQNDKLIQQANSLSLPELFKAGQSVCTAANAISKASGGKVLCGGATQTASTTQ